MEAPAPRNKKVYVVLDPDSGDWRYVGCTVCDPRDRLRQHRSGLGQSDFDEWLRGFDSDVLPEVLIAEEVAEGEDWRAAELRWINRALDLGHPILNVQHVPGRVKARVLAGRAYWDRRSSEARPTDVLLLSDK